MIVYNETYVMDEAIHHQWVQWMQAEQIPAIMKTGWFSSYTILSVLDSPNEGVTYCVQYVADSRHSLDYFMKKHFNWFQQLQAQKFENQFVMFNSVMNLIASSEK